MSFGLYEIQRDSLVFSRQALEAFDERSFTGILSGISLACASRAVSLFALFAEMPSMARALPKLIGSSVCILKDGVSLQSLLRVAISVAFVAAIHFARMGISLCGVFSPELVYKTWRMHKFLLWMGLVYRAQVLSFPRRWTPQIQSRGDQNLRHDIIRETILRIERQEASVAGQDVHLPSIVGRRIWREAIEAVERPIMALAGMDIPEIMQFFQYILPLGVGIVPPTFTGTTGGEIPETAFGSPIRMARPLEDQFFSELIESMRGSVQRLYSEEIYTKDEIEDLQTAFHAVLTTALCSLIVQHCSNEGRYNSTELTWENAGHLSEVCQDFGKIVKLYRQIPVQQRDQVFYYLCLDEDRVRRKLFLSFPLEKKMKLLRDEVVRIRGSCIEKEMVRYSRYFSEVFSLK